MFKNLTINSSRKSTHIFLIHKKTFCKILANRQIFFSLAIFTWGYQQQEKISKTA